MQDLEAWKVLTSGGIGGVMYWLLTYPTDVIKSTMQTDSTNRAERKYSGWMDCATKIYRADGMKGFFKGFTPCLLRSFPANAVYEYCILLFTGKGVFLPTKKRKNGLDEHLGYNKFVTTKVYCSFQLSKFLSTKIFCI